MKKIGIYKITSPSGKVYIGQAIDISKRWNDYKNLNCKGQRKLFNSLNYYGVNSHTFEIIMECAIEDLNYYERHYQEYYDVLGDYGLNLKYTNVGDKKQVYSAETKLIMSLSRKEKFKNGYINPMYGIEITDEHRKKLSESKKGKKHSEETCKKRSKSMEGKNIGKVRSDESKLKISQNSAKAKKVVNIQTGDIYISANECERKTGYKDLHRKLNGLRKNKTTFRYL
jgi:group I intron endonuclease